MSKLKQTTFGANSAFIYTVQIPLSTETELILVFTICITIILLILKIAMNHLSFALGLSYTVPQIIIDGAAASSHIDQVNHNLVTVREVTGNSGVQLIYKLD